MKIRPLGDQFSMRTKRRTDMQLVIAFRDSGNAPKNMKHEVVLVDIEHYLKMYRERDDLKPHTSSTSKSEEMHVARFTLHSL